MTTVQETEANDVEENLSDVAISDNVDIGVLDDLFAEAIEYHQAEQWADAESAYSKILSVEPDQPNANYNLGMLKLQIDQSNASLSYFKSALSAVPEEAKYWISYVEALMLAGQLAYASEVLIDGLEQGLHGEEVDALINQLAEAQPTPAKNTSVTIASYAGQPDILAMMQPQVKKKVVQEKNTNPYDWAKKYPINAALKKAITLQQAGEFKQAKRKFTSLLKLYPKHPIVMTSLGSIELATGDIETGVKWLEKSLAIESKQTTTLSVLSIGYNKLQRFNEAVKCADEAIAMNPDYAEAHVNRGNALKSLERYDEAVGSYKRAILIDDADADGHFNLGCLLNQLGQYEAAAPVLQRCVELRSNDSVAAKFYADVLFKLKKYDEAISYYHQAIKLDGKNVDAYFGRGVAQLGIKAYDRAQQDFKSVIKFNAKYAYAYVNLALALCRLGRYKEAVATNQVAMKLLSKSENGLIMTLNNQGLFLVGMQCLDEALVFYNQAIEKDVNCFEAYWNKSHLHLLQGDFKQGWSLYEYRWKTFFKGHQRSYSQPLWLGKQNLSGKTLFIYPEQGLGDYIQFCRYIAMFESLGAKVVLEVPKTLATLIPSIKGSYKIVEPGSIVPPFDFHCPLLSLPLAFNTELETIPADIPYIYADAKKTKTWKATLGNSDKLRVGLVWSGSVGHEKDYERSIPLAAMKSLFSLPVEFHALQKEIRPNDMKAAENFELLGLHQDALGDFSDTAALIENMDLVIAVDTSTAHLAGAMGKECWVLLQYAPDFRWMLNRSDSPWYPSITLFRQPSDNNWKSTLDEVKAKLEEKLS